MHSVVSLFVQCRRYALNLGVNFIVLSIGRLQLGQRFCAPFGTLLSHSGDRCLDGAGFKACDAHANLISILPDGAKLICPPIELGEEVIGHGVALKADYPAQISPPGRKTEHAVERVPTFVNSAQYDGVEISASGC